MNTLLSLGSNLRKARKQSFPSDDMTAFALRIGVSRATLQKMEKGDFTVSLGKYYRAAEVLDLMDTFIGVLAPKERLFDD